MVAQLDSRFIRLAPERAISRLVGYLLFEGRPLTTKGRWWNPVVFANLRLATRVPPGRVDRPVFIVGMGRSGTTLLGRILAAHPEVGFLNEPKAMWHVVRGDEDVIGSYAPPGTGRLYLDEADADAAASRRYRALFSWYLRLSRSRRLVDKYPELVFRAPFVRALAPDARFLLAVRSPWSTLNSVAAWSTVHGTADSDWWGVEDLKWRTLWDQAVLGREENSDLAGLDLRDESDHHVRAAVEWAVSMRQAAALAAEPGAKLVRYEALVGDPRQAVADILRFCELAESPRTEGYAAEIVSANDRSAELREKLLERLPTALVEALDGTWSRLDGPA